MKNPFRILRLLFHVRRPSRIVAMPVVTDGFWLRRGYEAMTFFGTIVAATDSNARMLSREADRMRRHETIHLRQAQSTHDSWLLFYLLYFWHYLRALPQNRRMKNAAYLLNPFELEAYRHMDDPAYLDRCAKDGATEWRTYARMTPRERLDRYGKSYGSSILSLVPLLLSFLSLGCQNGTQEPAVTQPESAVVAPMVAGNGEHIRQQEQVQAELRYYLERHDVQDEGFDMVARYAAEGDSTLSAYLPEGPAIPLNSIRWRGLRREGKGIFRDCQGRIIIGRFRADTLVSGLRIDRRGIYAGMFNSAMEACGHGSYRADDGSYYEGHWEHDRREGFGFCVSPTNLRAGWWRNDEFRGERMQYTSDRIYGIDISRYQHEQGRRVYPIQWKKLRICHLGRRISDQRVSGSVDYPVSYVYIKSTQGITIKNRYYANDYQSCRRQGIPVGAYHFFSTKCSGTEQACFFLVNTRMSSGDLPPVLDVEPSDAQIAQMGGVKKMFDEIRQWLSVVEAATGTSPLLYVNQRFVNRYLVKAPDLKENYHCWIARYGEYKPDVHLALWQLSSDGRVTGIRGHVDLNVFNGYDVHWQEFLKEATIK